MASGTATIDVTPTIQQTSHPVNWVTLAVALFGAAMSVYNLASLPVIPLVPVPDPISVVVPPKPIPPTPINNGVSIVDKHGKEFFQIVTRDGKGYRERREAAIEACLGAIDAGCDPGEVRRA